MDLLLNELTLYSKIDTNRIPYNFSKINVMEYFDDCVEEIGLDLEAKNIGLSYFNYAGDDVQIIADPEQLKRVIHNIINNSIKYLDKPKGFINIRVKDVGDFIQVEIEDNGKELQRKTCHISLTGSSGQILQEILQPAEVVSVYPLSVKLLKTMAERYGQPVKKKQVQSCILY